MPQNKSTVSRLAVCFLFIVSAGVLRLAVFHTHIAYHCLLSLIYIGVLFFWIESIQRRFAQKEMKNILILSASLMIMWIGLRTVKYEFVSPSSPLSRYIWYLYYVPLTLVPLLMFLATLNVGKTDPSEISRKWLFLFIPAGIIIIGILTNDLHGLAFPFTSGLENWRNGYSHGPFYYAAIGFFILGILGIMAVVFKNCTRRRFIKFLWIPSAVLTLGVIYFALYATHLGAQKPLIQIFFEFPEFTCFSLAGFWESLVLTHMIPSNTNHEEFFRTSSIHAGLTDRDFSVRLKAASAAEPTKEQIEAAGQKAVFLDDGDTLLKSRAVKGGHFYWTEDIKELNRINRELEDTGDYLLEETAMLDASTKIEEEHKRTEEQNRLYDSVAKALKPQLDTITEILDSLPENEDEFRETMKYTAILAAFVKRRSNLLLLKGAENRIKSEELKISVAESLEYVRLCGAFCCFDIAEGLTLDADTALFLYDIFEKTLEETLPAADAVFVRLSADEDTLTYYMEFGNPTGYVSLEKEKETAKTLGGEITVERSDGAESVTFIKKTGGGAA